MVFVNGAFVAVGDAGIILQSGVVTNSIGPLKLEAPERQPEGWMRLFAGPTNGSEIVTMRLPHIQVYATSELSARLGDWSQLPPGSLVLTNGMLRLDDPASANLPRRYYIFVENPQ